MSEWGGGGVVREVSYPGDISAVARGIQNAAGEHGWFWLDGHADGGWSYFGIADEKLSAQRGREQEFLNGLRSERDGANSVSGWGWVVALGYEFGVGLMGVSAAPDDAAPGFALRADAVLAMHESERRAELRGSTELALDVFAADLGAGPGGGLAAEAVGTRRSIDSTPKWRQDDKKYLEQLARAKFAIADGEAYVLCLTDTAIASGEFDPLELYLELRERGGAIRGGVVATGDRALVSASPEQFLSVRDGDVATHPIKGTRRRGLDPVSDQANADELAADPKELAENLMIVDLMRNDLSRVCTPGTVRVEGFRRVEQHPHVHQLVSTVSGRLMPGLDALDAVRACFPGGSMTGAPKRRAVEILADLEAGPRGLYSGCFGWLSGSGDAELAMTIRAIELRGAGGGRYTEARVGAGGGITADSDPLAELQEKTLKAAALFDALIGTRPGAQVAGNPALYS